MTDPGGGPSAPDSPDDIVDELAHLLGDRDLAERAVAELRREFRAEPEPSVADRHLAAMRTAAAELHAEPSVIDLRGRRVRRTIAGGAVALITLSATGGLAAAGVLPAPVQDAVSKAASVIAIDLPRSSTSDTVPTTDPPGVSDMTDSTPPGQSGGSPSDTAPSRSGGNPSDTAPGQSGGSPSDTAPGRSDGNPSDTAPGQSGGSPSDTAPGRSDGNPSDTAPGQSGDGQGNPGGRGGN